MSVITDLPKTIKRTNQIISQPEKRVAGVVMELDVLRKQGILVDLNITGKTMFTKTASFDEVGFARDEEKDARYKHIKPGIKYVIPEQYVKKVSTIESRMRQALNKHSRKVTGCYPFVWMPYTAHEAWVEIWNELLNEFNQIKAEIIDAAQDGAFVDWAAEEYTKIAMASWNSIEAQGYKWAVLDGKSMDQESFIDYVVEKAVARVPSPEEIEARLQADYVVSQAFSQEDLARDEINAAAIREQLSLSRELNQIEVSRASEQARAEAWQIQAAQREREIKIEAMLQAEAEHARAQLQSVVSPFAEIFGALRSQMAKDASDILASIKKSGFVRGKVAERGRGLLEMFDLMATHDDRELREKLIALRSQLGPVGTKQTDDSRDVETIAQTLSEIMQLEKQAARDLAAGPSRFSALDV